MAINTADALSATFQALADPTRRAILARLASGEADVSELMRPSGLSQPTISKHLQGARTRRPRVVGARCAASTAAAGCGAAQAHRSVAGDVTGARGRSNSPASTTTCTRYKRRKRVVGANDKSRASAEPAGATAELPSDREIVITRVFRAPRPVVFDAWTRPERVAQWWDPQTPAARVLARSTCGPMAPSGSSLKDPTARNTPSPAAIARSRSPRPARVCNARISRHCHRPSAPSCSRRQTARRP